MVLAGVLLVASVIALGLALAWRSNDQERLSDIAKSNCLAIEQLKAVVRPDPFNFARTRSLLMDLGINPDSEMGQRLLVMSRRTNARERRELAPSDC